MKNLLSILICTFALSNAGIIPDSDIIRQQHNYKMIELIINNDDTPWSPDLFSDDAMVNATVIYDLGYHPSSKQEALAHNFAFDCMHHYHIYNVHVGSSEFERLKIEFYKIILELQGQGVNVNERGIDLRQYPELCDLIENMSIESKLEQEAWRRESQRQHRSQSQDIVSMLWVTFLNSFLSIFISLA